jgi:hypothetical protein
MRTLSFATVLVLGMTAMSALAQTPPGMNPATGARPGHEPGIGNSLPLSTCPSSFIGENATTQDYLRAARASLVAGITCQAQQSLAMAETRALDRSVVPSQASVPDDGLLVSRINDARRVLGDGDNTHAIQLVDLALSN